MKSVLTSLSGVCPEATVITPVFEAVKYDTAAIGFTFCITNVNAPPSGSLALAEVTNVPVQRQTAVLNLWKPNDR